MRRPLVAIQDVRDRTKADLLHNDALPNIEVNPNTFEVRIDGELADHPPVTELPMTQRYDDRRRLAQLDFYVLGRAAFTAAGLDPDNDVTWRVLGNGAPAGPSYRRRQRRGLRVVRRPYCCRVVCAGKESGASVNPAY